ncbi:MAG: hypothetical protein IJU86_03520 [Firmicutes bacterium]|nr:hypothetical protein [Bacillota bacterium]
MSNSNFSPKSSNGDGAPLKEKARCAGERSTEKLKSKNAKILTLKTTKTVDTKKKLIKTNMAGQKKIQADFIRDEQNKLNNVACAKNVKIEFGNNFIEDSVFDKAVQNAQAQNQNIMCEQKNMDQHLKVGDKGEFWGSDSLGRGV